MRLLSSPPNYINLLKPITFPPKVTGVKHRPQRGGAPLPEGEEADSGAGAMVGVVQGHGYRVALKVVSGGECVGGVVGDGDD